MRKSRLIASFAAFIASGTAGRTGRPGHHPDHGAGHRGHHCRGAGRRRRLWLQIGSFDIKDLISAVPNLDKLAIISGEQVVNIGSQDMNNECLADAGPSCGRGRGFARYRRSADHPRHRHDGGNQLFPELVTRQPSRSSW
jgi:hypothetical protein